MSASRAKRPRAGFRKFAGHAAVLIVALCGAGAGAAGAADQPGQAPTPLIIQAPSGAASEADRKSEEGGAETSAARSIERATIRGIEVNRLAELSPDSVGVLDPDNGGFGLDMWRGTDREVVIRLLPRLPSEIRSRGLRDLARRLLLSIATPPAGPARPSIAELARDESFGTRSIGSTSLRSVSLGTVIEGATAPSAEPEAEEPPASLLALRVERLRGLGDIAGLNRLLAVMPSNQETESIARARVDGLLLVYEVDEACRLVRRGIAVYHEVSYWPKALVFCQMVAGETDQMMLGLDLLREQGATGDTTFFALAGAMSGGDAGAIGDDAELSPLHFAMMRVMTQPLPPGSVERASPALRIAIAVAPNADLEQRARAAERACEAGAVSGGTLARVYAAFDFAAEELASAISTGGSLEGPRGRALLYQAARQETLPATRAEVLRVALDHGESEGLYHAAVAALEPLLSEIQVQPDLAWFAATAGRAYYATGQFERASAWMMLGKQEALLNPRAVPSAAALWPYSRLAGGNALTTDGSLAAWRAAREGMGDRGLSRLQALLRASFQALGEQDPLPWIRLAADAEPEARSLPDAALLYALQEASEARRVGETVLLSLILLGEAGLAESHTMALGAVLSALDRVGLVAEARAIAIEAALKSGV
jgi:hypothetical protein